MGHGFLADTGGPHHCFRFFEDLMLCAKTHGIDKVLYKCHEQKEDYYECILPYKKNSRLQKILKRRDELVKEGKYPVKN